MVREVIDDRDAAHLTDDLLPTLDSFEGLQARLEVFGGESRVCERSNHRDLIVEIVLTDHDGLEGAEQAATLEDEVAVYIRPEDIKLIYPDRPVGRAVAHNQVTGRIRAHLRQAGHQTLRVSLENDSEVEVRFPGYAYIRLSLDEGAPVRLALRQDSLVILQPPGSQQDE